MAQIKARRESLMKTKDLICYVGAPVRTTAEVVGVVAAIGVAGYLIFFLGNYIAGMASLTFWGYVGWILLALYFVLIGSILVGLVGYGLTIRTKDNFDHCQEYWHSDEVSDNKHS